MGCIPILPVQRNGVAGCERTIRDIRGFVSGIFYYWYWLLSKIVDNVSKLKTDSTSGCLVLLKVFIFNDKAMATIFEEFLVMAIIHGVWQHVTIDPDLVVFNFSL